jgi:hypothetical protein
VVFENIYRLLSTIYHFLRGEYGIVLASRLNLVYMGRGHTWEVNGRFMMNFSENVERIQTIEWNISPS